MNRQQTYIVFSILLLVSFALFLNNESKSNVLPSSVGDPLEVVLVKNYRIFPESLFSELKKNLNSDFGPSPQPENVFKIIEIEKDKFKGILQRHQNIIFVERGPEFQIKYINDLYARNQKIVIISLSSSNDIRQNSKNLNALATEMKTVEMNRLIAKSSTQTDASFEELIALKHNITIKLPRNYFLAYDDDTISWFRRETNKLSQGILFATISEVDTSNLDIKNLINSYISKHIEGPMPNSYMVVEKSAPLLKNAMFISGKKISKFHSLWKMKNDFMGGVYQCYFFKSKGSEKNLLIYTYLYNPGEKKSVPMLHLESIISTIKFLE